MWMVILVNSFSEHYSATDTFLSAFGEVPNLVFMQVMRWVPLGSSLFRGQGGWEGFESAAWEPTANTWSWCQIQAAGAQVSLPCPPASHRGHPQFPVLRRPRALLLALPGVLGSFLRKSTMDIRNLIDNPDWVHLTHWVPCWNFSSSLYRF